MNPKGIVDFEYTSGIREINLNNYSKRKNNVKKEIS
jgi:hypothetical protein